MLMRSIPLLFLVGAAAITISIINTKHDQNDVNVLPVMIPVVVLVLAFGIYRGVNAQKLLFESYRLTITNNLITREQLNTPTISIYFNEIQEIVRYKNDSFTIRGNHTADVIFIPPQIGNRSRLELLLQQIQPIVDKANGSFMEKYRTLISLLAIGLMVCVYTVNNKIVVGLAGIILVAFMIWSFVQFRRDKNIDHRTRRTGWYLLLVIASVIAVMIIKLSAHGITQNH